MHKYEIMLLVQATANESVVNDLINSVFKSKKKELKKLERTQLAYPIKKVNTAQYYILNIEADADEIKEFGRREILTKEIIRTLIINLDTEKALQRKPKNSKVKRSKFTQRPTGERRQYKRKDQNSESSSDENRKSSEERNTRPRREYKKADKPTVKKEFVKSVKKEVSEYSEE